MEKGSGEGAAAAAIREHGAVLARVCMALLGDAEAATSALERVAREAAERDVPADRSPKVFLLGLAHRACTTHLSKMPSRRDEAPATERMGDAAAAAEARAALAKLRPTEREAVVLHLVGGLDAAEVAAACGIDPKVARERIARALVQLADANANANGKGGGR